MRRSPIGGVPFATTWLHPSVGAFLILASTAALAFAPRAFAGLDTMNPGESPPGPPPEELAAATAFWSRATFDVRLPGRRHGHTTIVRPESRQLILFGGYRSGSNVPLGDAWSYAMDDRQWKTLTGAGTGPSARYGHTAIHDPVNDRMVLFGGIGDAPSGELWILSFAGTPAWTSPAPPGGPDARYGHSAIYDAARRRMVVYGGFGADGQFRDDLWALSLDGDPAWSRLEVAGSNGPGARDYHSAIYDAAHDRMVVFGGNRASGALNDLWYLEFDGTPLWREIAPTHGAPAPRLAHAAVYDAERDRMIVYAGVRAGPIYYTDMWAVPLTRQRHRWTPLEPGGELPSGGNVFGAAVDPNDGLIVYGGEYFGSQQQMHVLSPATLRWEEKIPLVAEQPRARFGATATWDPVRHRIVMFGGGENADSHVWSLDPASDLGWRRLLPGGVGGPTARYGHSAIYDPLRDRLLVFGGFAEVGGPTTRTFVNEVWSLDLAAPAWTQLSIPGGPSPRDFHSAVYDAARDRMVVFGGNAGSFLDDVWALEGLGGTPAWVPLSPTGTAPAPRLAHVAHYDEARGTMLVFGGFASTVPFYRNDLWELALEGAPAWSLIATSGPAPAARYGASGVAHQDRLLLFGGIGLGVSLDDVHELQLSTRSWSPVVAAGVRPRRRHGHVAAFDPAARAMVVFGGASHLGERFDDTWRLDFPGAEPPLARSAPAMMSTVNVRLWTSVPTSRVFVTLARDGEVEIDVYDIGGRVVTRERREAPAAGTHDITPQFRPASGVYIVRVRAGDFRASTRWIVMR